MADFDAVWPIVLDLVTNKTHAAEIIGELCRSTPAMPGAVAAALIRPCFDSFFTAVHELRKAPIATERKRSVTPSIDVEPEPEPPEPLELVVFDHRELEE